MCKLGPCAPRAPGPCLPRPGLPVNHQALGPQPSSILWLPRATSRFTNIGWMACGCPSHGGVLGMMHSSESPCSLCPVCSDPFLPSDDIRPQSPQPSNLGARCEHAGWCGQRMLHHEAQRGVCASWQMQHPEAHLETEVTLGQSILSSSLPASACEAWSKQSP